MTEFEQLKKLLHSSDWPEALPASSICNPNSDIAKSERAEAIMLILVTEPLQQKRFLDFGCGEGHCAYLATLQEPEISVGYDIAISDRWGGFSGKNLHYTSEAKFVEENGPYDVVLLHDVIDHMTKQEAKACIGKVKKLMKPDGTLFMRTHPFCSRHATHLFHVINKAFMHLIFSEDELKEMGYDTPVSAKIEYPIYMYTDIVKNHFTLTQSESSPVVTKEPVEPFFTSNKLILNRVKRNFHTYANGNEFPVFQCEQQFLDYRLKPAPTPVRRLVKI